MAPKEKSKRGHFFIMLKILSPKRLKYLGKEYIVSGAVGQLTVFFRQKSFLPTVIVRTVGFYIWRYERWGSSENLEDKALAS